MKNTASQIGQDDQDGRKNSESSFTRSRLDRFLHFPLITRVLIKADCRQCCCFLVVKHTDRKIHINFFTHPIYQEHLSTYKFMQGIDSCRSKIFPSHGVYQRPTAVQCLYKGCPILCTKTARVDICGFFPNEAATISVTSV